ncbi:MAG: hypothetical protein JWL66_854, partial [Sphingomonadales bacterium]|nr:hypothetical protein [Sphingomonadales bacterium]
WREYLDMADLTEKMGSGSAQPVTA